MVPPAKEEEAHSPIGGSSEGASAPLPFQNGPARQGPGLRETYRAAQRRVEPAMAKYDPLEAHLARRSDEEFEISFEEVERIIGDALPMSASRPQWWANETPDNSHVQSRSWRNAGYDAFLLPQGRVLFRRRSS
jgi:hypothetical protein